MAFLKQTHLLVLILVIRASLLLVGTSVWGQNKANFSGSITDPASAPVAKVSVTLSSLDRVLQAESDAHGQFRFPSVSPAVYKLELSAPGFLKQTLPINLSDGDSRSLTIVLKVGSMPDMNYCGSHPSVRYESAEFDGRQLAGIVREYYDVKPVAKAKIALFREGEKQPILKCRSDQTGQFKLNDPPAGRYTLRISRQGYWEADLKEFLIPRENSVFVNFPLLKRNRIVVCQ
jgi:Carboxypeptidase regulatory-like domain